MDPREVRKFEDVIGQAIRKILEEHASRPGVPAQTAHLMAKAAVTVLEAVVMSQPGDRD